MLANATGADSYILCELAGATYALRSDEIDQLEMVGQLTPVPNAPPFIDGVTSVRGRVIPVLNLRARFGFARTPHDLRTRLVVVRADGRTVGLLVDSAREFATIPEDAIQPPPEGLAAVSGPYLRGTAQKADRLILVLDVRELLRSNETTSPASSELAPTSA